MVYGNDVNLPLGGVGLLLALRGGTRRRSLVNRGFFLDDDNLLFFRAFWRDWSG